MRTIRKGAFQDCLIALVITDSAGSGNALCESELNRGSRPHGSMIREMMKWVYEYFAPALLRPDERLQGDRIRASNNVSRLMHEVPRINLNTDLAVTMMTARQRDAMERCIDSRPEIRRRYVTWKASDYAFQLATTW
jgi:hypothetical protein